VEPRKPSPTTRKSPYAFDGVLALGEESGVEAEGEGDFGRGEEVGFEDGGVESDEGVEYESVVLVEDGLVDESAKLVVRLDLGGLETDVGDGEDELTVAVVLVGERGNVARGSREGRKGEKGEKE
jgi:hypothetical protein